MAEQLDDLVKEFLVESYENLDRLDRDLIELEKQPQDRQRLASIFRTIHTIKGTCGFFGFSKLESVTHVGENLLSHLRDGQLLLNPEIASALLALVDAVRGMLACIETSGQDGIEEHSVLIATLTRLQEPGTASASAPVPFRPDALAPAPIVPPAVQDVPADVEPSPGAAPALAQPAADHNHAAVTESNIRVDIGVLDKLMNLVGELVLARNQILQFTSSQKDAAFLSTTQRLNLITTELQEGVMKTRMQPIGTIWNKFPRVVRDLAALCGKQVRLEMEGKETELDKIIIEAIKDPLTHLVRNTVDHGIEPPEVRVARGKPAEGCLFLRAFHEGGQVNIEISDDGAGINVERVKVKALERGLVTREQAARMSEREAAQLIFLSGFSTAEKVTNVSGRGVGMDVVKTNIEKIGGTVDLQTQPGRGTAVKIKIPLTLAIIPALIVTSGADRYAIPQVSLLKLVRLEGEHARTGIEQIHGAPVYRLRGNLLPIVCLRQELGEAPGPAGDRAAINIVVLQADDRQFGLVVEGINDTEEIVVKPLGKLLNGIPLFAGATIMGDGRVALILDVLGIAQRASVIVEVRNCGVADLAAKAQAERSTCQTLLLLSQGGNRRLAVPLALVARLEEIPVAGVESGEGQEVVQYRGQIMPLVRLANVLGSEPEDAAGKTLQVVVYTEHGRSVGLVVDRILDIVEAAVDVQHAGRCLGVLGSAVIQQRVTDLLDIPGIIRTALPDFFEHAAAG